MVNAAVRWGVEKFVYISTDEVYGQLESASDPLWTEESKLKPRNPYSATKAAGEFAVQAAASSYGLNYCITRSSNNYGPRQTPEKFIPKVIKCINEGNKIPVYGQGMQIRDWLHVADNCAAIMKIAEAGENGQAYNISAHQEFTNIEVVNEISKIMGKGMELVEFVKDRPGHDFRYGIDTTKIKALGWEPSFKFKVGLAQTIQWYLNNNWFLKG
jgi:dTDP-glucose 4,6-dehydratase